MTYREYITALVSTGLFDKNKAHLGTDIFNTLNMTDPYTKVSESAVKKWMDGSRSCNKRSYFPDGKVNTTGFINYLTGKTKDCDSWKRIQDAFISMDESIKKAVDFRVDLATDDNDVFFWSLINQFQRIFGLTETPYNEHDLSVRNAIAVQRNLSIEDLRNEFIGYCRHYKIMGIIKRNPPKLTIVDAMAMEDFVHGIDSVIRMCKKTDDKLYSVICDFKDKIELISLEVYANINSRFNQGDPNASYNMAEDHIAATDETTERPCNVPDGVKHHDSSIQPSAGTSKVKVYKRLPARKTANRSNGHLQIGRRQLDLPELTPEFIRGLAEEDPQRAEDIRYLTNLAIEDWSITLAKLSHWYDSINKWKESSQT